MEKLLVIALIITVIFFVIKVLEMKYLSKEMKPLKYTIRDTFFVFISSFAVYLVF